MNENVNQQQVIRFQGGGSTQREPITFEPTSRRPTLVSSLHPRQNGMCLFKYNLEFWPLLIVSLDCDIHFRKPKRVSQSGHCDIGP